MKILQVVPSIGVESSGPSYSVPSLCKGLAENGCDVELHFASPMPGRTFPYPVHAYARHRFPCRSLVRSPEMLDGLTSAIRTADIIHNNSFWFLHFLAVSTMLGFNLINSKKSIQLPPQILFHNKIIAVLCKYFVTCLSKCVSFVGIIYSN